MMLTRAVSITLALFVWCGSASAHVESLPDHQHEAGVTFTSFGIYEGGVRVLFTAPAADLQAIKPGSPEALLDIVIAGFEIADDSQPCQLREKSATDYDAIEAYQFTLDYYCETGPRLIDISYRLFATDPAHINHVDVVSGNQPLRAVFDARSRELTVPVEYFQREQGWSLDAEPPAFAGEKPELLTYLRLGFDHVIDGWDHLAFVIGLVLLISRFRDLALLITSFTVAHSITLALAALEIFVLPRVLTEMMIAVSIVYIGAENLWALLRSRSRLIGKAASIRRLVASFGFGLIHGFGFSYFLREMGLPPDELWQSLALFNIGVELAQLAVVILPFLVLQYWLKESKWYPATAAVVSVAVVGFGLFLLQERFVL